MTPSNDASSPKAPKGLTFKEKIQFSETVYKHCKKFPQFQVAAVKRFSAYTDDEMLSALSARNSSWDATVVSEASRNILCSISGFGCLEQELLRALLTPLADKIIPETRRTVLQTVNASNNTAFAAPVPTPVPVPVKRPLQSDKSAFTPVKTRKMSPPPGPTSAKVRVEDAPDWLDVLHVREPRRLSSPVEDTDSSTNVTTNKTSRSRSVQLQYKLPSGKPKVSSATHDVIRRSIEYCTPALRSALNMSLRKTEHSDRFRCKVLPHYKDSGCKICSFAYMYGCRNDHDPTRYRRALAELHEHVIKFEKHSQRGPPSTNDLGSECTYGE